MNEMPVQDDTVGIDPVDDLCAAGIIVPASVVRSARDTIGSFFERLSGTPALAAALDHLDPRKCIAHAERLQRYTQLNGKKLLEVGSGYGTGLAVFTKKFGADAYGIEPDGEGFSQSLASSRQLLAANGIESTRVVAGTGERLPFPDTSFDIVYSCNVLEHTSDPAKVLRESIRVLRPGGVLHFEIPNHLSYFEGHYLILQPPLVARWLLPWWVKTVFRRDPAFARTLRTEINPRWCRRVVCSINTDMPVQLISLGEELFLERLSAPFQFEMKRVASRISWLLKNLQRINVGNWIGHSIVLAQGHYPLYLTLRRAG